MSQQPVSAVEKYAAIVERMGLPIEGDMAELSKEPVGGLMGWHELAVTVRHISEGVGYNYPKLAQGLCQHLGFALARLTTLEAQLKEARQELAEQEREKLALLRQLPPEGDGGLWALQSLEDYFREGGHRAALANIRATAHNMGWCLDSMGCDQIVPTEGICPLCEHNSAPHPAPKSAAPSPLEGEAGPVPEYDDFIHLATADEPVWVPTRETWDKLTDRGKRNMMEVADLKPRDLKNTSPPPPLEGKAAAKGEGASHV